VKGITTNDDPLFVRNFSELAEVRNGWEYFQGTTDSTGFYKGFDKAVLYENGTGLMRKYAAAQDRDRKMDRRGINIWGKKGIAVSCMG
ncbi:hypothetical protein, partial [Pseudoalteromonas sp. MER144-MNA-CIBAN-0113]